MRAADGKLTAVLLGAPDDFDATLARLRERFGAAAEPAAPEQLALAVDAAPRLTQRGLERRRKGQER